SDKDWSMLHVGDPSVILVDAYPDQSFKGSISKIEQSSDPASGTYEVEVSIYPGNRKLAPGLFATVSIQAKNSNRQLGMIPVESLAEADKKTGIIYSVNDDRKSVARHQVQIAFIAKDSVAIEGELQNIHEVVKEGVGYLTESSRVKLAENNP
ncbi:MAG TPA: HlyD family efflux transporter periplasmic adaptor subunit, partial [Puia sp.]|nr:HlyD family efflux transporter periplasmic adaptor subunit [Puia sp.]